MVLGCINPGTSTCYCWFAIGLAQEFLGYICVGGIWGIIMALKVMAVEESYQGPDLVVGGSVGVGGSVESEDQ